MAFYKKYRALSFFLFVLAGVSLTATAWTARPGLASSSEGVGWTSLTFNASKLLSQLTVQIKIQSPAPTTDGLLTRMGAGLTESTATFRRMKLMTVDLRAQGRSFLKEEYSEKIWFNAADGRAYRRIRRREGREPWVKIYAWTEQGVRRQKIQPAGRYERTQSPMKWTGTRESFYPYPRSTFHSRPVSDPTYLLYLLSALEPRNLNASFEISVFGKEQLHRLTCRREKSSPLSVSFKTSSSAGTVGISKTISPIVYSVTAASSAPKGTEPETFSLLGLEKDIRIYLDPSTHLPIRVSGKNSLWGELVLDLSEMQRS